MIQGVTAEVETRDAPPRARLYLLFAPSGIKELGKSLSEGGCSSALLTGRKEKPAARSRARRASMVAPFAINWATLFSVILIYWFAGRRIKEQDLIAIAVPLAVSIRTKVEHLSDRICDCIKGTLADALSLQPVILDEPDDRTLIGESVIDEVRFGEWRDYEKRQARAITATPFDAGQRRAVAADARPVQLVALVYHTRVYSRGVDDW